MNVVIQPYLIQSKKKYWQSNQTTASTQIEWKSKLMEKHISQNKFSAIITLPPQQNLYNIL
jgi:hypothetical protein